MQRERVPGVLIAVIAVIAVTDPAPAQSGSTDIVPAETERSDHATVGLVDNQSLTADLIDDVLTVTTRYGVLRIPSAEIVKVRFAPVLSSGESERLRALVARVASEDDDGGLEKTTLDEVHQLGLAGGYAIIDAARSEADKSRIDDIDAILDQLRRDDSGYLGPGDEIVAKRFTVRGTIEAETFRFRCLARELAVPRTDIRHITYRELDFAKTFTVQPSHMEQQGWLVTGVELKKGQKFSLEPSGTMSYNGQSFGPTGLSNHRWNSRNVGCLQWRIGTGEWQLLGAKVEAKAETQGPLELCVHLYEVGGGGEFKVEYKTRVK